MSAGFNASYDDPTTTTRQFPVLRSLTAMLPSLPRDSGPYGVTEMTSSTSGDGLGVPGATISVHRAVLETVTLSIIWVLAVLGNLLACIVIHRSRRLQSTTNYFVVSLAAADLIHSFVVMPFVLAQELVEAGAGGGQFTPPASTCKFVRFIQHLVPATTSFVFVAIVFDRFYAIVHPLRFMITRGRAQRLVLVAWLTAFLIVCPCFYFYGPPLGRVGCERYIADTDTPSSGAASVAYVCIVSGVTFVAPAAVVCFVYVKIGKYIWRVGINGRAFQRTTNPVQRAKVKMIKMLMILNGVSALLMAPFFVVQLVACWNGYDDDALAASAAYAGAVWASFASAAAKPIVYVTYNANFRRGCKEMLCMSAMRCYRSHAYTITTTSTLAKTNHVGVATVPSPLIPPGDAAGVTHLGSSGSWPGHTATGPMAAAAPQQVSTPSPKTPRDKAFNYSQVFRSSAGLRARSAQIKDPSSTYV